MIERIIDYSARNPLVIILLVACLAGWGLWAIAHTPLDAIPDLSDTQVIIFTEWMGRSPDLVENQVTYPIVSSLLSAPRVQVVRGQSMFGMSFVYAIFEDGTDIYWARSRVLEYLSGVQGRLPAGVIPQLGPDATGVGWVYEYALAEKPIDVVTGHVTTRQSPHQQFYRAKMYYFDSAASLATFAKDPDRYAKRRTHVPSKLNLAQLRSFQDWHLRYWLGSIPGVAEVASVGGFKNQYQVTIDPNALSAYGLSLDKVTAAIRGSNNDVGGRSIEFSGREYLVRGLGYVKSPEELAQTPVGLGADGTPVLLRDVGRVQEGPDQRRGLADLDGEGDVVGGIIVMRYGENARNVISRVKQKLSEVKGSLPEGIEIVPTYDRSQLIDRSIHTLWRTLIEESIIVSVIIIIFLLHVPSAARAIITLPIAIVIAFIPMYYLHLTSNIMSLGGIAIAIGVMVDEAVVMIENIHKRLEHAPPGVDRTELIIHACKEIGRPMFFSLLVITVSFLPIFTLEAQEGKLFKPLAFTKTFSMLSASLLSITLAPMLMVALMRKGRIRPESEHPISLLLQRLYRPWVHALIRRRVISVTIAVLAVASCFFIVGRIGSEFMPDLNEGDLLYMPVTVPGLSPQSAGELLQLQDKILRAVPEVARVFGKVGRSETPTDPAPMSMVETTILIKPQDQWRPGMTWEKLQDELSQALELPGVSKGGIQWPIKTRIDMLSTGIRAPLGVRVFGSDLNVIERIGGQVEAALKGVRGTDSATLERATGATYLDVLPRREAVARYGLTVQDVLSQVESAIGGTNIDTVIAGRERYSINLRYPRDLRSDIDSLGRVLVPLQTSSAPTGGGMGGAAPSGGMGGRVTGQVPLAELADLRITTGPDMIPSEGGTLTGRVLVYVKDRDMGSYVAKAQKVVANHVKLPQGYGLTWTGQWEYMERVRQRLLLVVPLTLFIILLMLYFNFHSLAETGIVLLSLPFAITGSLWTLFLLRYHLSAAVWVGIIALAGLAAETGVVMIVYLDEAFHRYQREGKMKTLDDLFDAITEGAVQRIRPKLMTVMCILMGLLPLMWAQGSGADVMRRIAAPMIGGVITSTILTLEIVPAIYSFWRQRQLGQEPPSQGD